MAGDVIGNSSRQGIGRLVVSAGIGVTAGTIEPRGRGHVQAVVGASFLLFGSSVGVDPVALGLFHRVVGPGDI